MQVCELTTVQVSMKRNSEPMIHSYVAPIMASGQIRMHHFLSKTWLLLVLSCQPTQTYDEH